MPCVASPPSLNGIPYDREHAEGLHQAQRHDQGGALTRDLLDTWVEYKTKKELEPVALLPHPYEFFLYYDV